MAPKTTKATNTFSDTLSLTLLQDKMYDTLLQSGPKKTGELVAAISHPAVNLHIAKHALRASARFTLVQRKWDIAPRWETPERPFAELVAEFLSAAGHPITLNELIPEIAKIIGREPEAMSEMLHTYVVGSPWFTILSDERICLTQWMLDTSRENADDVLYYNFMEASDVEVFRKQAEGLEWETDPTGSAVRMVLESPQPIPFKVVAFFAWEHLGSYLDCDELYETMLNDEEIGILSSQELFKKGIEKTVLEGLSALASIIAEEPEEEEQTEDEPPVVTETDIEDIVKIVEKHAETTVISDVILQVFEIEPDEHAYEPTEQALMGHLKHDIRLTWLGAGRLRPVGMVPDEVLKIPESLIIPEYDFTTPDGEHFDIEMELGGLESALAKEVHDPLVQDVGDEDVQERPTKHATAIDCVLKYHHKQAGTFPLAQTAPGFFAAEPLLQEIVITYDGKQYPAWVNLETRLIYGMDKLYSALDLPISGGLFHLNATPKADIFDLEYSGEVDETASVNPGRLLDLLQLKEDADTEHLPTFEVMCRLLEHQGNGLSFPRLFVELNLVRRVTRMLVASILSGYSCFSRQAKTGLWVFDEKKKSSGFTRSKRKFVVKES